MGIYLNFTLGLKLAQKGMGVTERAFIFITLWQEY